MRLLTWNLLFPAMRKTLLVSAAGMVLSAVVAFAPAGDYFTPSNRLSGVGVDRQKITDQILKVRSDQMVDTQTFAIMRDPQALAGAERIWSPKLQKIFHKAEESSGLPSSFIAAVAYLESWGVSNAESPAGPKGIMQIAEGTARAMGLSIVRKTRYRIVKERVRVRNKKGKVRTRTVKRRIPYTVLVRDDRFNPDRAVPAAARYLARMENKFGGRDWAVFAYHCGEGCTAEVQRISREARGLGSSPSVAASFFGGHPGHNRELYESMRYHMERDFSPTYYFRIRRAEQLLALYKESPAEFRQLFNRYRNRLNPDDRAPHRLSVWLQPEDFEFQSAADLRRFRGSKLMDVFDDPDYFGFTLRRTAIAERDPENRDVYFQASPSAIGALAYIAFETRRLCEEMDRRGEKWKPIEVTALVYPREYEARFRPDVKNDFSSHASGQVFDIDASSLPTRQREALDFVLNDLGWHGYLGFISEHSNGTLHIGPAPTGREFFTAIFQEAVKAGTISRR